MRATQGIRPEFADAAPPRESASGRRKRLAALIALQLVVEPPFIVGFVAAAAISLALIRINRGALQIGVYFPELLRIPVLRRLLETAPSVEESHVP